MPGVDSYVQLPADSTGKKVRSFSYDPGGGTVYSQVMSIGHVDGEILSDATGLFVKGAYTEDVASAGAEKLVLVGAVRQDSIASSLSADGDYGYLKLDALGKLRVNAEAETISTSGTLTAGAQTVTLDLHGRSSVYAIISGTWVGQVQFYADWGGGLETTNLRAWDASAEFAKINAFGITSNNSLILDVRGAKSIIAYCTNYTSGTINVALYASDGLPPSVTIDGDVIHDQPDSGSPIKVGGKASNTTPAVVADGDRVNASFDLYGRQAMLLGEYESGGEDSVLPVVYPHLRSQTGVNYGNLGTAPHVYNGTTWDRMRGGTNGLYVGGNVAHDAVDAGNPIKFGGRAANSAGSWVVSANNDRVDAWFGRTGTLMVTQFAAAAGSVGDSLNTSQFSQAVDPSGNLVVPLQLHANLAYNGSTWDRMRGDTNGLYVGGNVAHDAVDAGNPIKIGGRANSTAPTAVAIGDRVEAWLTTRGEQAVFLNSGDGSTVLVITPADAMNNGIFALTVDARNAVYNGTTWDRMRGDTAGLYIHGNVAHNAADAGNPVKFGGRASADASFPYQVSSNGRVDAWFNRNGVQIVTPYLGSNNALSDVVAGVADVANYTSQQTQPLVVGAIGLSFDGSNWDRNRTASADALVATGIQAVGSLLWSGGAWDRPRSVEAFETSPNVLTGILAAGVGPGFDIKLNPANLATAVNSVISTTVHGVPIVQYGILTSTSGTYTFEVSADESNWITALWLNAKTGAISSGNLTPTNGDVYRVYTAGWRWVRIRVVTTLGATVATRTTQTIAESIPGTWRGLTNARAQDVAIVDGSGNQVTSFGGTQYVEDVASAGGESLTLAGTVRQDTPASSNADGDYANLKTDGVGRLWVNVGASANLTVDSELEAAAALADATVNPTASRLGSLLFGYNGATWDRLRSDTANGLDVDVTRVGGTVTVGGVAATDASVSGNPVYIAGRSSNAEPTAVSADGEVVPFWLNRLGAQMMALAPHLPFTGSPYTLTTETAQYTTTQTGTALVTPTGGKRLVVLAYQIQAGGTTAGTIQLWFESSNGDTTYTRGTDLAIFDGEFAPSNTLKPGVVQTGVWPASAADMDLRVTDSAAINPLTITVWYYEV